LVSYLVSMAQHKLLDEVRRQHAQKNDVDREQRLTLPDEQIISRDPTPSAVAIFNEQWENLVDRQPANIGRVVQMRYEGATYQEIADELQINEKTARQVIMRLERGHQQPANRSAKAPDTAEAEASGSQTASNEQRR
jgi:RNA polymerase sigma-70 factor (ECF subfamily)